MCIRDRQCTKKPVSASTKIIHTYNLASRSTTSYISVKCSLVPKWVMCLTVKRTSGLPSQFVIVQGGPKKPDHFWKSVTPVYDDAERCSLHQSVHCFIWSKSAVLHLSQLNIHCTSMVKPCYSKNDDSSVIHRSHVTAILRGLRRIGFYRSGLFHISKRSVLYQE